MNNDSKLMTNDIILQKANIVSINLQIKIENFYIELKNKYEKIFSSYPDIKLIENIDIIYKRGSIVFKEIMRLMEIFDEYKSIIDFISEIEPNEKICWVSNLYNQIKSHVELKKIKIDDMLSNIFLYKSNSTLSFY
jgi:hypothetical protein